MLAKHNEQVRQHTNKPPNKPPTSSPPPKTASTPAGAPFVTPAKPSLQATPSMTAAQHNSMTASMKDKKSGFSAHKYEPTKRRSVAGGGKTAPEADPEAGTWGTPIALRHWVPGGELAELRQEWAKDSSKQISRGRMNQLQVPALPFTVGAPFEAATTAANAAAAAAKKNAAQLNQAGKHAAAKPKGPGQQSAAGNSLPAPSAAMAAALRTSASWKDSKSKIKTGGLFGSMFSKKKK